MLIFKAKNQHLKSELWDVKKISFNSQLQDINCNCENKLFKCYKKVRIVRYKV